MFYINWTKRAIKEWWIDCQKNSISHPLFVLFIGCPIVITVLLYALMIETGKEGICWVVGFFDPSS